jgi:hypothetical protein
VKPACARAAPTGKLSELLRDRVSRLHHSDIERGGISPTLVFMSKSKIPATGEGYLGEIMVHRLSHAVGVVENVTEAKAGWPPQITLKLADGSFKKGRLSDFREPTSAERKTISPE